MTSQGDAEQGTLNQAACGPREISCAANPYDVRPALDVIEKEIARRRADKPLVVIMGETHCSPTDIALQQGVLARLLRSVSPQTLIVGYESPHNALSLSLGLILEQEFAPSASKAFFEADNSGHVFLATRALRDNKGPAPVTAKNLAMYILSHQIPCRPVDAPHFHDLPALISPEFICLDQTYKDVEALVSEHAPQEKDREISVTSPTGMALRNRMIVKNSLRAIKDAGSQICMLKTGLFHVFGLVNDKDHDTYTYEDSLCARFLEAGVDILPVIPITYRYHYKNIPESARGSLQQAIKVTGLDSTFFIADSDQSQCSEEQYLQKISAESGGEIEIVGDQDRIISSVIATKMEKVLRAISPNPS